MGVEMANAADTEFLHPRGLLWVGGSKHQLDADLVRE